MVNEINVPVNIGRIINLMDKLMKVVEKKSPNHNEGYLAVKMLCLFYEETMGLGVTPETEKMLKQVINQQD